MGCTMCGFYRLRHKPNLVSGCRLLGRLTSAAPLTLDHPQPKFGSLDALKKGGSGSDDDDEKEQKFFVGGMVKGAWKPTNPPCTRKRACRHGWGLYSRQRGAMDRCTKVEGKPVTRDDAPATACNLPPYCPLTGCPTLQASSCSPPPPHGRACSRLLPSFEPIRAREEAGAGRT